MSNIKITILGCGPSSGIPAMSQNGEFWGDCDSKNIKNRRLRSSVLIEHNGKNILIDASPDLRYQFFRYNIKDIDALLLSHAHYDHISGINEIRFLHYNKLQPTPLYCDFQTMKEITNSYSYLFERNGNVSKIFSKNIINYFDPFKVFDLEIMPIEQDHDSILSTGFRISNFAYSPDVKVLSDKSFSHLKNLDVWLVDCIGLKKSIGHANLETTLSWIKKLKPKKAILTNIGITGDYDTINKITPKNVICAFDGMVLELD